MLDALRNAGCRIIHEPSPDEAPFRITFETPSGERMGIIAYAFLATFTPTKNRPDDEHSFQIKYGSDDKKPHDLWQDPYGVYVTLLIGINPEKGFFVSADPVLHSPTKFFIRVEFKQEEVVEVLKTDWHSWERRRRKVGEPVEVLVGGTATSFLRLIEFERDAMGEDQGHRQLLAERASSTASNLLATSPSSLVVPASRIHLLAQELALTENEVLDVIAGARRLKMAVRGWVAEEHLVRTLSKVPGVTDCMRSDEEGGVDVLLRYRGSREISVECKNVLRKKDAQGNARLDFQRTRASKNNPCSRYYQTTDFDLVAACMHAVTLQWEFRFAQTANLDVLASSHPCAGHLSNRVKVNDQWSDRVQDVLRMAANA